MRARFIFEKFTPDSDPIHDMGIGIPYDFLMGLLEKRVKYLKKLNSMYKKEGYSYITNIRIEDTTILYNTFWAEDVEDCRFKIIKDKIIFIVAGNEGEENIEFKISERPDITLKIIKKHARDLDAGGLK